MQHPWFATTGRHIVVLAILSVLLVSFGTAGYMLVAQFPFVDALYMTIITLTTVGYGEILPLDTSGRVFTILLILAGVGFVAYNLAYFSQLVLDGNLLHLYRRRKVKKKIEHLNDHYIVCGYGQMGQIIVDELLRYNTPVVLIEPDESLAPRIREKGLLHLTEDATEEETLEAAGIRRARGLVTVVSKDTDNVFIVLTARDLNRDLLIFARSNTPGTERRLSKAGADRVVSPFAIGAYRIAHNILRPTVTDFVELALSGEGIELSMEEILIPQSAPFVGKALRDSGIRGDYNLIVVAIKRKDGSMIYNPIPSEILDTDDTLVVIGPRDNLARFGADLFACPLPTIRPGKC